MCQRIISLCATVVLLSIGFQNVFASDLSIKEHDLSILVNETKRIELVLSGTLAAANAIIVDTQHEDIVNVNPNRLNLIPGSPGPWTVELSGLKPGHSLVSVNSTQISPGFDVFKAFVRVTVQNSYTLEYVSLAVGWLYFAAWSISFYPQIYQNCKRESVVGLNFDFLALNLVGFTLYSVFNIGLYWVPEIEASYFERHPRGLNPVQLNDIVFAVHATFATVLTIIQCFLYESGSQRVSTTARSILSLFFIIFMTILGLALFDSIEWLDFLYYCSYIKLTITLIKYIPQAYMNYQRKSTMGWSIGNVLLDFTGGTLSMAQMIINAYNYDDWGSLFGDPTKFGLGLFSVIFDIFFIVQHYLLYRSPAIAYSSDIKTIITEPGVESLYQEKDRMLPSDSPA